MTIPKRYQKAILLPTGTRAKLNIPFTLSSTGIAEKWSLSGIHSITSGLPPRIRSGYGGLGTPESWVKSCLLKLLPAKHHRPLICIKLSAPLTCDYVAQQKYYFIKQHQLLSGNPTFRSVVPQTPMRKNMDLEGAIGKRPEWKMKFRDAISKQEQMDAASWTR